MKKSVQYYFDVDDAVTYGVDAAILLSNLRFWVFANKAKERNFKDGRYWTYNSAEALTRLYPFWNRRKIARLLQKLEKDGAINSMQVSQGGDQTKWYTIAQNSTSQHVDEQSGQDEQKPLDKNDQCSLDNSDQPLDKNDQSLYIHIENTVQKPNKGTSDFLEIDEMDGFKPELRGNDAFCIMWSEWKEYRKAKGKPMSVQAQSRMRNKLNKFTAQECIDAIDIAIQSDWTGIFPKAERINIGKPAIDPDEDIEKLI